MTLWKIVQPEVMRKTEISYNLTLGLKELKQESACFNVYNIIKNRSYIMLK